MKTQNRFFLSLIFTILILILLPSSLHLEALPTHPAPGIEAREVKVSTDYWSIDAMDTFNVKATSVTFNHPNSGKKKVKGAFQVVAVTFSLHNPPGNGLLQVPRNYFLVNKKKNSNKIVANEGPYPKVVKVPVGKVKKMTNYYIVDNKATELKDLKVVYSSATRAYKKYKVFIPLTKGSQE